MKRRIITVGAALLVAALSASATLAGSGAKPIYRVDSVTVKAAAGRTVSIEAKGAVNSGGWERPALRVQSTSPTEVTIVFVALPPPPTSMVIQAMLPVDAKVKVPLRQGVTIVKIAAESNSKILKVVR